MKDEIKEKISIEQLLLQIRINCNHHNNYEITSEEKKMLLDYITNLQEELEEQKRIEQASLDTITNLQESEAYYKLRLDKALKYIDICIKENFNNYNSSILKGILKGVVIPVFEENEMLKKTKDYANDEVVSYCNTTIDLQQRIDKAIEYINAGKTFETVNVGQVVNKIQNDLLDILQGEDKDE